MNEIATVVHDIGVISPYLLVSLVTAIICTAVAIFIHKNTYKELRDFAQSSINTIQKSYDSALSIIQATYRDVK